ncbi:translation initiation factor eIF2B subunit alpha-like [Atheta coriaria]|uniref:translation initiation factor eIF2B subunit alpha-like n=1 Tax=Dalotia coriaria TaxID=877792 RepID=UPI0031F3831E
MSPKKPKTCKSPEEVFHNYICENEDLSVGIASIMTLMHTIKNAKYSTLQELRETLHESIKQMKQTDHPVAAITSGCELFMRFITLIEDSESIEDCKKRMLARADIFLQNLNESRGTVARIAQKFILDGSKILTHSKSRVVLAAMKEAAAQNKKFQVFVTNTDKRADTMETELRKAGISVTMISDAAIGYIMEYVDFIMVGAESVVESGGIVNKLGTYPMAICAKEMNKPFYVLTESFKFSRLYILSQDDLPDEYKYSPSMKKDKVKLSMVDYTPPIYITLLFTDLGILTPSAVSDELIKLYL